MHVGLMLNLPAQQHAYYNVTVCTRRKLLTHPGMKVAIVGIGGLGHLAIQLANKMGAVVRS